MNSGPTGSVTISRRIPAIARFVSASSDQPTTSSRGSRLLGTPRAPQRNGDARLVQDPSHRECEYTLAVPLAREPLVSSSLAERTLAHGPMERS